MKITKTQLENLIKEETELTLLEEGIILNEGVVRNIIQTALEAVGLAPGVGEVADLINFAVYAYNKEYFYAFLSLVSLAPLAGDLIGKGTKLGIWFAKTFPKLTKHGKAFLFFIRKLKYVCKTNNEFIKEKLELIEESIPDSFKIGTREINMRTIKKQIIDGIDMVKKIVDIFAGGGPTKELVQQLAQIDDKLTGYIDIIPAWDPENPDDFIVGKEEAEEAPLSESKKINKQFLQRLILECLREEKLLN